MNDDRMLILTRQLRALHKDIRGRLQEIDEERGQLEADGVSDSALAQIHQHTRELDEQMLWIERYMYEMRLPVAALWADQYGDTIPLMQLPEVEK